MMTNLKLAMAQTMKQNPNKKESDSNLKQAEEKIKLKFNKPDNSLSSLDSQSI
jgi:hypothetical protein